MNNLTKIVTNTIKKLSSFRTPEYDLPADSLIDKISEEIIHEIFNIWQWIKVEDFLPEIHSQDAPFSWSSPVLCFLKDKTIHILCKTNLGDWKNFEGKYSCLDESVTHWIPLPIHPIGNK